VSDQLIGNHLRKMRFFHDEMTQADLAKYVQVTRQTIIALEAGRYLPSLELAMKLACVFGESVDKIFFWKNLHEAKETYQCRENNEP